MPHILVVDDDPADQLLIRQVVISTGHTGLPTSIFDDVEAALSFLRTEWMADGPLIIVTDLNMPGRDGYALIEEVRKDPGLRALPVIVLSSSSSSRNVTRAYAAGANAYHVKPLSFDEFKDMFDQLVKYWGTNAICPPGRSSRWHPQA